MPFDVASLPCRRRANDHHQFWRCLSDPGREAPRPNDLNIRAMPLKTLTALTIFGGQWISNPGPIGAAVPSSRALARRMASLLPAKPSGYVIELGAGTGAITEALLERGLPPVNLILVERSPVLVRHLRERFPQLRVIEGDAVRLSSLLFDHLEIPRGSVSHVVSSLPLRSLPKWTVARITREVRRVLPPDGRLLQYTYDLRRQGNRALAQFTREASSIVWMNLPPARVDSFQPR